MTRGTRLASSERSGYLETDRQLCLLAVAVGGFGTVGDIAVAVAIAVTVTVDRPVAVGCLWRCVVWLRRTRRRPLGGSASRLAVRTALAKV